MSEKENVGLTDLEETANRHSLKRALCTHTGFYHFKRGDPSGLSERELSQLTTRADQSKCEIIAATKQEQLYPSPSQAFFYKGREGMAAKHSKKFSR